MPLIDESAVKKQISANTLERVYLIIGEDGYLKKKYCDKIKNACINSGMAEFDLADLDGKDTALDVLQDELIRFPVMSQKRCVIITNLSYHKMNDNDRKRICEMIKNLPDTVCFIIYQTAFEINYKKPEKWNTLISAVNKVGATLDLGHKSPAQLRSAIRDYCTRRDVRADVSVVDYMIEVCSQDLNILKNEADKLCRFKGRGGCLTKEDVDKVCAKTQNAKIFDLTKEITRKNAEKSLEIMNSLLFSGVQPSMIAAVMTSAFIDIYRVSAALESGVAPADIAADFGYPKNVLFRLQNARSLSQRLSRKAQRDCLNLLLQTDLKLKSTGFDRRLALESAVLGLIGIIKGEVY